MSTRIFKVDYWVTELANGKDASGISESKKVVAKDAEAAISKTKVLALKPSSYYDEELKKNVKLTRKDFEAISVNLVAESD